MSIDLKKLKVVLPEGCTVTAEATLVPGSDNVAELEITVGSEPIKNGLLTVKFEGDQDTTSFSTVKYPVLVSFGKESIKGFTAGTKAVIPAVFDAVIDPTLATIVLPTGWKSVQKAVSEDEKTVFFTVMVSKTPVEKATLKLLYKGAETEYSVKVIPNLNSFNTVTASATRYPKGKEFEIECTYKFDVTEEDIPEVTPSAGLKLVDTKPAINGRKAYYRLVGTAAGSQNVTVVAYKGDKDRQAARMIKLEITEK